MQNFEDIEREIVSISKEYNRLCDLLTYEEILLDKKLFLKLEKQKQFIHPIVLKYEEYLQIKNNLKELQDVLEQINDNNEKALFTKELEGCLQKEQQLKSELANIFARLNAVMQSITIEIVSSKDAGSSNLLEKMLEGYTNFCKNNALSSDVERGDNSVKISISGLNAYEFFKSEMGVHNSDNAICQVFVYDQIKRDEFDNKDIKIVVCRASGAGGQHINTTDSAIKATHLKTGISAICQDERSQFQNKEKAIENLKEKVNNYYKKEIAKKINLSKQQQLKEMKRGKYTKVYDFQNGIILKGDKQSISLSDFLLGKVL